METFIASHLHRSSSEWRQLVNDNPEMMQSVELRKMDAKYFSLEEFVLDHGQQFDATEPHPLSKRHRLGKCYENAWTFIGERCDVVTRQSSKYTYVEGYAMDAEYPLAMLHGWVVTNSGKVIDPTWGWKANVEYFGIPFDWRFYNRQLATGGYFGMIDYHHRAILHGKWHYKRAAKFPAPELAATV